MIMVTMVIQIDLKNKDTINEYAMFHNTSKGNTNTIKSKNNTNITKNALIFNTIMGMSVSVNVTFKLTTSSVLIVDIDTHLTL